MALNSFLKPNTGFLLRRVEGCVVVTYFFIQQNTERSSSKSNAMEFARGNHVYHLQINKSKNTWGFQILFFNYNSTLNNTIYHFSFHVTRLDSWICVYHVYSSTTVCHTIVRSQHCVTDTPLVP